MVCYRCQAEDDSAHGSGRTFSRTSDSDQRGDSGVADLADDAEEWWEFPSSSDKEVPGAEDEDDLDRGAATPDTAVPEVLPDSQQEHVFCSVLFAVQIAFMA